MSPDYDIIIVGAGAVGTALTALIANSGLRIALLDGREPAPYNPADPLDLRVFALSRASEQLLRSVDAWESISQSRLSTYTGMHVWQSNDRGHIEFDAADVGEPNLGHIVENRLLQTALLESALNHDNVTALWSQTCAELTVTRHQARLQLDSGRELSARLVIGADGARSRVRRWAGIEAPTHHYKQRAVVSHLTTEQPHLGIARQVFLDEGVLALLPLADGRVSLVWSTSDSRAQKLLSLDADGFNKAVSQASEQRLGMVTASDRRASFALTRRHAEQYVRARIALVGDAAHTVHPLAGQGVNLGLLDAGALATVIQAAVGKGRDWSSIATLRRYERDRRTANAPMIRAFDSLQKLFNTAPPLNRIAGVGLSLINRITPARNALIKQALGLGHIAPAHRKPPH